MKIRGKSICSGALLVLSLLFVGVLLLSQPGCHPLRKYEAPKNTELPGVRRVVVVGFHGAKGQGQVPELVRSPLSGTVFMAEPVGRKSVQTMNDMLFESLLEGRRFELISPGQALGVTSRIVSSEKTIGMPPIEVLRQAGAAFNADAVMSGYLYRWREREGGAYAAGEPASVAFDLYVVRPTDGAILWSEKFDKSQTALTHNLLDTVTFKMGGGRWMTAEELARNGLSKILEGLASSRATPDAPDDLPTAQEF
jgi:hypothetical protein